MLLQDIRQRNNKLTGTTNVDEKPYVERKQESQDEKKNNIIINPDSFFNFHINEHSKDSLVPLKTVVENDTFAGHKDLLFGDGAATIRSAKGTVRGVKNRVRAGIETFLQINNTTKVGTFSNNYIRSSFRFPPFLVNHYFQYLNKGLLKKKSV